MTIPNIIDPSVPIGKDDSCNVEIEKFGERRTGFRDPISHRHHGAFQWYRS